MPRYRQKLREVPGRLGLPVWVDDPDFDLAYHVRHAALAPPGTPEVLGELVGRLLSRQLERDRPLWEIYLVEGLADGRLAVVTKTHHAMVDGIAMPPILPIDHIYAGSDWRMTGLRRGPRLGSDHFPLVATLRLQEAGRR